jgi:hypothetical protein
MKLESLTVTKLTKEYWQAEAVFENDGERVIKLVYSSSSHERAQEIPFHRMRQVLKAYLEAERDFAFNMFGPQWRDHVGPMLGTISEREKSFIDDVSARFPEIRTIV